MRTQRRVCLMTGWSVRTYTIEKCCLLHYLKPSRYMYIMLLMDVGQESTSYTSFNQKNVRHYQQQFAMGGLRTQSKGSTAVKITKHKYLTGRECSQWETHECTSWVCMRMRHTIWAGQVKKMVLDDGTPEWNEADHGGRGIKTRCQWWHEDCFIVPWLQNKEDTCWKVPQWECYKLVNWMKLNLQLNIIYLWQQNNNKILVFKQVLYNL